MPAVNSKYPSDFVGAVKDNNIRKVADILKRKKINLNLNIRDSCWFGVVRLGYDFPGRTPLAYTSGEGYTSVVKLLLQYDADVNQEGGDSMTPLHRAAENGHTYIVRVLLDAGADVNGGGDIDDITPLHLAVKNGHTESVCALLEGKANVNRGDDCNRTPLHQAAECGNTAIVCELLNAHADVNRVDEEGLTPLDLATCSYIVNLLENEADAILDNKTVLQVDEGKDIDNEYQYTDNKNDVSLTTSPHNVKDTSNLTSIVIREDTEDKHEDEPATTDNNNISNKRNTPTGYHETTSKMLRANDSSEVILPEYIFPSEDNQRPRLTGFKYKRVEDQNQQVKLPVGFLEPPSQLTPRPYRVTTGRPTEKELSDLAADIGCEWLRLAGQLGITYAIRQQIAMTYPDVRTRIFEMLAMWRVTVHDKCEEERMEILKAALKSKAVGRNRLADLL